MLLNEATLAISSARSSDTDMTVCCTVLQSCGGACQCYVNDSLTPASPCISYYKQSKLYRLVYDDFRQLEYPFPPEVTKVQPLISFYKISWGSKNWKAQQTILPKFVRHVWNFNFHLICIKDPVLLVVYFMLLCLW